MNSTTQPGRLSGRLIDAFLALEETRRFAVAAERCHVSPSAFSQMITRLEEQVGARLFDRDTRNVALTPEGEVFSHGAHRIAAEMDSTLTGLQDRARFNVGRVSIAAPPSLAASWLPQQMAGFRDDYPGLTMRLHDVVSDRCLEMVARGDVDFGLNAQRGNALEFEAHLLFNERLYLICQTSDPLASRKSVSMKDLRHHEFIHSVRSGSVWQQMVPMTTAAGIPDSGLEVTQFGTLAGLVGNGFGISVVPQFAVELCRRPGIAVVRVTDRKALRPIYMIKRKQRSLSVAAEGMWSRLAEAGRQVASE
ncbi:MAG: LysR family transcriptional regulator [Pseudomonadota bacterium]